MIDFMFLIWFMIFKMAKNCWEEYLGITYDELMAEVSELPVPPSSVTLLPYKDINIYGIYPMYEKLVLVTCKYCGKRMKPQCYKLHMDMKHKCSNGSSSSSSSPDSPVLNSIKNSFKKGEEYKFDLKTLKKCSVSISNVLNKALSKELTTGILHSSQSSFSISSKPISTSLLAGKCSDMHGLICPPQTKACDIQCHLSQHVKKVKSVELKKNQSSTESGAISLSKALPGKKRKNNIKKPKQGSQFHQKSKKMVEVCNLVNNKNINGIASYSFSQQSPIRPLPQSISLNSNKEMKSHSYCESQVLTPVVRLHAHIPNHNAAIGT